MADETLTRRSEHLRNSRRRRRRRWPWVLLGVFLILAGVAGAGYWVASSAMTVKNELEAARPLLSTVKAKVLDGQASTAQADVEQLEAHVAKAEDATRNPAWGVAELVPVVGENLRAVRTISETVADVVDNAVAPAVALGDTLSPAVFKPSDGAVNLSAIESVLPVLDSAGTALTSARSSIESIPTESLIGPVKSAVGEIEALVSEVEPALATAKDLAPVLPGLLGADGPRNYLIVFENSAEARPLGGIAAAQILVTADQGRVSIAQETSGRSFAFESEDFANEQVGAPLRELFLVPFGLQSQNNTLTPRVDLAAHLTRSMWTGQRGITPDTIIFVDPVALSYILDSTGPIALPDGTELRADNATELLLNSVYQMFPGDWDPVKKRDFSGDPDRQDAYFSTAAGLTFSAIMNGQVDVPKFISAVQKAGGERRLTVSSSDQTVQALVVDANLQGAMPTETADKRQVGIYLSDYLGGKMDYYLRTSIAVGQQQCTDGTRRVRVQIDATNIVDPAAVDDLSIYITGADANGFNIPLGDLRVFTYVYAPVGASVLSIEGTTSQDASFVGPDGDYQVARGVIQAGPGETESATIDIDVSALPEKQIQALVGPLLVQPEVNGLEFAC